MIGKKDPRLSVRDDGRTGASQTPFDYLIVGAGFAGGVVAERLASQGARRVVVVERRSHVGGNAHDRYDKAGILIHRYGPHIFHTNSEEVFSYLSQFTEWRSYEHRVQRILDHENIRLLLNVDYRQAVRLLPHRNVVFTGPIDEFFDHCYGPLPYRSLDLRFETHDAPTYQPAAVVNYPNEHAYTRITEFKYMTGQEHPKTTIG